MKLYYIQSHKQYKTNENDNNRRIQGMKDMSTFNIICIGDSVTKGLYLAGVECADTAEADGSTRRSCSPSPCAEISATFIIHYNLFSKINI